MDYRSEIDTALSSEEEISREKVAAWIESTTDLPTLAKLYRVTGEGYCRIKPELGKELECRAVQNYLLECIRHDVQDSDEIESRWEAAGTLHGWLRHLLENGDSDDVIRSSARAITEIFLNGDENVRDVIETAFLEHALESVGLRPYFAHWSEDSRLREAWARALDWGKAHPDFSWSQLQELRRIMEKEKK